MSYVSEVLADSPLAYWRLGEASGTTAADASGNGRDGTYLNTPTLGATSLLGTGTDTSMSIASNTGQVMSVTSAAWMDVSSLTIECLVKFSSATDSGNGDAIVSRYNSPNFNWLIWRNTSGQLALQIRNTSGTVYNISATTTVTVGAIYHVVGTFDGSTCKLYVNGTQAASAAVTGTVQTGGGALDVGRYSGSAVTTPGAQIDEVAIYNTALSNTRIEAHYAITGTGIPNAQVETNYVEAMASGVPNAQVETNYVEAMATGTANVQVETNYVETMVEVLPVQVESVYTETLLASTPPTLVESVYTESLLTITPPVNTASVYVEILVMPVTGTPFKGWGIPV
jgi:hypothetical protein